MSWSNVFIKYYGNIIYTLLGSGVIRDEIIYQNDEPRKNNVSGDSWFKNNIVFGVHLLVFRFIQIRIILYNIILLRFNG